MNTKITQNWPLFHWNCVLGKNIWNIWGEIFLLWTTRTSLNTPATPQAARACCSSRYGQLARKCEACYTSQNTELSGSCMTSTFYRGQWENMGKHCVVHSHLLQTTCLYDHLQTTQTLCFETRYDRFQWDEAGPRGTGLSRVVSCDNLGPRRTSDCLEKQRKRMCAHRQGQDAEWNIKSSEGSQEETRVSLLDKLDLWALWPLTVCLRGT